MKIALDLVVGDMVDLEGDHVFDPGCEDRFCPHRAQSVEVAEYALETDREDPGAAMVSLVFVNGDGDVFSDTVSMYHQFADPESDG